MPVAFNPPPTLQAGDAVAIIAPASGQKTEQQHLLTDAIVLLQRWGLHVVQKPLLNPVRYLSADDSTRAQALHQALTTPDIKAVFATRGGYGCARILPLLTDIVIPTPRLLVGFSDITTLHLHFSGQHNLQALHAPNLATPQLLSNSLNSEQNRQTLYQALFHGICITPTLTPLYPNMDTAVKQRVLQTPVTGGCLSLLTTSLGSGHDIQTAGKTLFIEEIGESPYCIDRMLTHLKNAGKLNQLAGIVIGDLVQCSSPNIDVFDVLCDVLSSVDCPVFHTAGIGHSALNTPWFYDYPFMLNSK